MEEVNHRRDVDLDFNGVIKSRTEKDAIELATAAAKAVQGLKEIAPTLVSV